MHRLILTDCLTFFEINTKTKLYEQNSFSYRNTTCKNLVLLQLSSTIQAVVQFASPAIFVKLLERLFQFTWFLPGKTTIDDRSIKKTLLN